MQGVIQVICSLLLSVQVVEMVAGDCMVEEGCSNVLGGDNRDVPFTCSTDNRHQDSNIIWFHNGEEVDTASDRYSLNSNQDRLTIHNVIGTDEGQYTCSYEQTSGNTTTLSAGCLIVYGRSYYETCSPQDPSCIDRVEVSSDGTTNFNLKIAFYETGCSGHHQDVTRTVVKKGNSDVYTCSSTVCTDHVNRWWTVNKMGVTNISLTLHQTLSSDRAQYTVETEVSNPATGTSIDHITKHIQVTAPDCDSQPPKVNNATISTHETGSMFIIGSQVNYSCSEGCMLQGNYSLTCQVQYHVATWPDPPTCSCPGTSALDHSPSTTSIAVMLPSTPAIAVMLPSTPVMTPSITKFSEENNGSTPVYVPIVVLLLIAIAAITASAGVALACRLRQKRWKEQKTVGNMYCTKVMLRTNGQYSHDGPNRESVVEDGVTLGSGDEESELEEKKNSPAVDV